MRRALRPVLAVVAVTAALPEPDLSGALVRARLGDEGGFSDLVTALQPRVLRYLIGLGFPDPEDLAQETWLQVVRDLPDFEGDSDDFRGWLFTVARHRALDSVRRAGRQPVAASGDPSQALAARPGTHLSDDEALQGMALDRALTLLSSLPRDQADVVALRVLAGLDVASTARILGRSPGAVRVACHRGLHRMADLWQTPAHLRAGVTP